jgi:hypothetical protein
MPRGPIIAKLLTTRKAWRCETCNKKWPPGSRLWREINYDLEGDERGPFYFCVKCDGEEDTRKEYRKDLNEYLNDQDSG